MDRAETLKSRLWAMRDRVLKETPDPYREDGAASAKDMDDLDRGAIEHTVDELIKAGWPDGDIMAFCSCLEHVDHTLDEDTALRRMAALNAKHPDPNRKPRRVT